jgi:phage-related protein
MASKGKVSQEEVMQLAEALPGFNANAAIASQLGLSVADTLDKISAGGVDAQTGVQALLKGMAAFPGAAGAMAAQAQTLSGVFSTFKDTVGIALTNAFQPVIPEIKSTLTELTPVIGDAVGQLAPSLGHALSAILPLIGKLITAIVPILTPIIDALGPALDALGPALVPLGEAIGEVVVALGPSLPLLGQFVAALAQLAVPVLLLLAAILKPLTPLINFMTEAIAEFNKALSMIDWAGVGQAIGTWAEGAWNDISGFFTKWAKGIFDFGAMLGTALKDYLNKVGEFIGNVVAFVKALPGRIVDAAVDFINTLYNAGRNIIQGLINGIGSMGSAVWNYVKGFTDRYITQPIKEALGIASPSQVMADEVGRQIPAGIEQGIKAGLPSLESLAAPIIPVGAAGNAGMGGLALGGITINLNFYGDQPTEGQARSLASAAGDALLSRLATQRTIALAGRTA